MGKYEVTQSQYKQLTGLTPSHFSSTGNGRELVAGQDTSDFPVEQVSWTDATNFCRALTERARADACRRPGSASTERSQWEYACRAGCQIQSILSEPVNRRCADYAWYAKNGQGRTHEVGHKLPNAWGLYDVHGNVWEWCQERLRDLRDNVPDTERVRGGGRRTRPTTAAIRTATQAGQPGRDSGVGLHVALVRKGVHECGAPPTRLAVIPFCRTAPPPAKNGPATAWR